MVLALMVSLVTAAPSGAAATALRSDDPPVKGWLNQDNYFVQGDRARVNVKVAEDGYLVVLRADADGRIRVLFPLDPSDDPFVRGGSKIEVREQHPDPADRKSTRLNSSHVRISY